MLVFNSHHHLASVGGCRLWLFFGRGRAGRFGRVGAIGCRTSAHQSPRSTRGTQRNDYAFSHYALSSDVLFMDRMHFGIDWYFGSYGIL